MTSREMTIDLTTKDMSSELRYGFGNVLGTQNRLTLSLASSHFVLCLNPIKGTFNIVSILTHTHTHTHTNIHLAVNMASIIPKRPNIHLSWHLLTFAYHGISNQPSIHLIMHIILT